MEAVWKVCAIAVLTVILGAAVGKTEKDIAVVLSVAACCVVILAAMGYFSQVLTFLRGINSSLESGNPYLEALVKIAGVALLTELICLISADAGNSSLGKAIQILGNAVILTQSLPILESFFQIVQEILRVA